ncbi:MAG: hypothetical protein AAGF49_12430, partial [Pseudomonadota bacterium]
MSVATVGRAPAPWADAFARRIKGLRWLIILFWALVGAAGMVGSEHVVNDPDVLIYFDKDRPERQAFDAVEARFGQSREVVTLIVPEAGDVFAPAMLRAMAELAVRSAARPEVSVVRTALSDVDMTPQEVLAATDETLALVGGRLRQLAAAQGDGVRTLVAQDGSVAAVAAIVPELLDNAQARRIAAAHRTLKEELAGELAGA